MSNPNTNFLLDNKDSSVVGQDVPVPVASADALDTIFEDDSKEEEEEEQLLLVVAAHVSLQR